MESIPNVNHLREEIAQLKEKLRQKREELCDTTLIRSTEVLPSLKNRKLVRANRLLKGHVAKIYAMSWSRQNDLILSASQDGKLLIWDALTQHKVNMVPLRSSWVMSCAFGHSPSFVASGGLDNLCTIWNVPQNLEEGIPQIQCELAGHSGYISSCKFLKNDSKILTSSGDSTIILWDIEHGQKDLEFLSHSADVMTLSIDPTSSSLFVTGSCDGTAKMWDLNSGKCVRTFEGHQGDVNAISFFPNGQSFGTGSDDHTCRLFDLRADRELCAYPNQELVTSLDFSCSGRFMFAGYDNYSAFMWDVLKGEMVGKLEGHHNRISCLGVSPSGMALCTGSWDSTLAVWS